MSTAAVTADNRWALISGGVATLLFGIAAVFWPGLTLTILIYLFSAWVLISGIANIIAGFGAVGRGDSWFLTLILGALEAGVGVYLLRHPHVAFHTLILLIGFTLIVAGLVECVVVYFGEKAGSKLASVSYLSGFLGIVAGIIILFASPAHGVAFVWLLGLYAIIVGTLQIAALSDRALK
jgi:uncharacterized membrane protein HdeD (DUF308 family)